MPVYAQNMADMTTSALRDLGRLSFVQIAQELQEYVVMPKWLKKDKIQFDSGWGIQKTLMLNYQDVARHSGFLDEIDSSIPDVLANMQINWVHADTNWSWFRQEKLMNRGAAQIADMFQARRAGAMLSLATELENKAWSAPTSSSDETNPYGLPWWIVKNATEGHNGGYPSGFSDSTKMANINLTTYSNFKNYTWTYSNVTADDVLRKLRRMCRKIGFKTPVNASQMKTFGEKLVNYTNEDLLGSLEMLAEDRNDNLGGELMRYYGSTMHNRHPIEYVPKLDADTEDPFYSINHDTFYPVVLKGDYLHETVVQKESQPNVTVVVTDLTYNFLCVDRRRNSVGYLV